MKRVYLLGCIMLVGLMWGCDNAQTASDEMIIRSASVLAKDNNSQDAERKKEKQLEKEVVTEEYKESFRVGEVEVNIDATISKQSKALPIVNVTPHVFTSEELKKWGETLFAGKELVEYFGIEEQRTNYQYHNVAYLRGETDSDELPEMDGEYYLKFRAADCEAESCEIRSVQKNMENAHEHSIRVEFEDVEEAQSVMCSDEDAIALAQQVFEKLGFDDQEWKMDKVIDAGRAPGEKCTHFVTYKRYFEGIPSLNYALITYGNQYPGVELGVENLEIRIADGKVAMVNYSNPLDVEEIVDKDAQTLSTEEMLQCFKKQIQSLDLKKAYISGAFRGGREDSEYEDAELEIKVTSIEEGVCCIKNVEAENSYQMIPVWSFGGDYYLNGEYWAGGKTFMVINAMDGCVVDEDLGFERLN